MISTSVYRLILVAVLAFVLDPATSRAQGAGSITVAEKHVGGYSVYYLRNSAKVDGYATVSFTSTVDGKRTHAEYFVAGQTSSADLATSQDTTKPVILSTRYNTPQVSDSSQPTATP